MGKIRIIQTAKDTADRLTEKDSIGFNGQKSSDRILKVDKDKTVSALSNKISLL